MKIGERPPRPKDGEERIKVKFAILPVWIGEERIWLERYYQRYKFLHRPRRIIMRFAGVFEGNWSEWEKTDRSRLS